MAGSAAWWALLALLLAALPAAASRVVLMEGTYRPGVVNTFTYLADETAFERAELGGIDGRQTVELGGERLRRELDLYFRAQAIAGGGSTVRPLYVLLDPEEAWVYTRWGRPFVLRMPDGSTQRVPVGFIHMGKMVDYVSHAYARAQTAQANRQLLDEVNRYYAARVRTWPNEDLARHVMTRMPCLRTVTVTDEPFERYVQVLRSAVVEAAAGSARAGCDPAGFDAWVAEFRRTHASRPVGFEEDVNRRYRFRVGGEDGPPTLDAYVQALSFDEFVDALEGVVRADLEARGAEDARWEDFARGAGLEERRAAARRRAAAQGINEAVAHELGHVIQYTATGGPRAGQVTTGNPDRPTDHSSTTLSNPRFAFAEGWALALEYAFARDYDARARRLGTRIEYASSHAQLSEALNRRFAAALTSRLRQRGVLAPSETLAVDATDPWRLGFEAFVEALSKAAAGRGAPAALAGEVLRSFLADPANADLHRRWLYVDHLERHAGQRKTRYDMLASEASVAHVLYRLDRALDGQGFERMLAATRSAHAPTLGAMLEMLVHQNPALADTIYTALAEITEEVLVTKAQADLARSHPGLQIDVDRDGRVPGASLAARFPDRFPPESITLEPVPGLGPDPLAVTEPVAVTPGRPLAGGALSGRGRASEPILRSRPVARRVLTLGPADIGPHDRDLREP